MSPTSPDPAPPRAVAERVAELNRQIRALFKHRDTRLTDEQRAEYHRLLDELDRVGRGDVTTAA